MINFYNAQNRKVDSGEPASAASGKTVTVPAALKNGKTAKPNIAKYTDPTGEFGTKEFKWAIWYVKHKLLLYRLGVIALIVFSTLTVGYSLWKAFDILFYDLTAGPQMDAEFAASVNYAALHPRFTPAPLDVLNSYVLPGGTDKVDAFSEISNSNERYIVYFEYYFDFNGAATEKQAGFLLPGESRPIAQFGIDTAQFSGTPNLMLQNIRWKRISAHQITDVLAWQTERLNFSVENFTFSFAGEGGVNAHALRFTLRNNSPYGYKNPLFYLGLYQSGGVVGIMRFDLADFQSLESREIDLRNFVQNLSVSEIKLYPVIDLYDNAVYLPPKR